MCPQLLGGVREVEAMSLRAEPVGFALEGARSCTATLYMLWEGVACLRTGLPRIPGKELGSGPIRQL